MSIYRNAIQSGATSYNILNVEVDTAYDFGDGNHTIKASGCETDITTGNGNSDIKVVGTGSDVITGDGNQKIVHYGSTATIKTGKGNQNITSIGDDKTIYTDSGDDEVTFIGNNCTLGAGNGDNKVVFWGNNATITTGDGDDDFKTFDQLYDKDKYDDITAAFIASLPTEVWEDWTKLKSNLIDYKCKKSLMSKTRIWTYEDVYDVETIFSRYINGLKNVNIDMGAGNNTANLTIDTKTSKVISNGKDVLNTTNTETQKADENIQINDDWSLDTSLGNRKECELRTEVKTNTRVGGVFVAAVAAVAAVVLTVVSCGTLGPAFAAAFSSAAGAVGAGATAVGVAGTVGAAVGTAATVASAAMTGVGLAQSGYNVATGQAHSADWVNIGSSILSFAGAPVLSSALKGGYAVEQGDYIGAAVNLANATCSLGEATGISGNTSTSVVNGVSTTTKNLTKTGYVLEGIKATANATNFVDKSIKVANGENSALDFADLGMSLFNTYSSIDTLASANYITNTTSDNRNFVSKTIDYIGNEMQNTLSSPGRLITSGTTYIGEKLGSNTTAGKAFINTGNALAAPFVAAGNVANKVMDGIADPAGAIESISTNFMNGFNGNKTETKSGTNVELTKEMLDQIENDALAEEVYKGNLVSQKVEEYTDKAGNYANSVISSTGGVISGITSVIGNNLLGTDNWIGNGTIWVGDKISNGLSWAGNKVDGGIDSTGSAIAHPIDTTKSTIDSVKNTVSSVTNLVKDTVSSTVTTVKNSISSEALSTNNSIEDDVIIEHNFYEPVDIKNNSYNRTIYNEYVRNNAEEYIKWCAGQNNLSANQKKLLAEVQSKK